MALPVFCEGVDGLTLATDRNVRRTAVAEAAKLEQDNLPLFRLSVATLRPTCAVRYDPCNPADDMNYQHLRMKRQETEIPVMSWTRLTLVTLLLSCFLRPLSAQQSAEPSTPLLPQPWQQRWDNPATRRSPLANRARHAHQPAPHRRATTCRSGFLRRAIAAAWARRHGLQYAVSKLHAG